MSYKDFENDFKKELYKDAIVFHGQEDYLSSWALKKLISRYVDEQNRSIDVQILDGAHVTVDEIIGSALAYSMFSKRRIVIVQNYLPMIKKDASVDEKKLLDFCDAGNPSGIIVFVLDSRYEADINAFGTKLMKHCSAYSFDRLEKAELQQFINKRIHEKGKLIGHREMEYLIDVSGYFYKNREYSLSKLNSDIEKICAASDNDSISAQLIDELLVGVEDRYVFGLVDAMMLGNKSKAMSLAESIIREEDAAMTVLGLLTKQFEIMYDSLEMSKKGMSIQEMSKRTGTNEFRFKKAFQAARKFDREKLREMLINAYNIDLGIKTGNIDKDVAFELLIVSI